MDDDLIVGLFRDRDENAIAEAKKRYEAYCMYIANNILTSRQDAEECVNDVLLAAWNSIPPQEPKNLKTYLGKLTRETAIDRFRMNTAKKRVNDEAVVPLDEIADVIGGFDVETEVEEAELSRLISKYLRSVNETKRNVFIRRYWYYDSVQMICERYGFKKSKVISILKRTRDDLAGYLRKEGYYFEKRNSKQDNRQH